MNNNLIKKMTGAVTMLGLMAAGAPVAMASITLVRVMIPAMSH